MILDTEASIDDPIAATNVVAEASGLMLAGEVLAVASPNTDAVCVSTRATAPPKHCLSEFIVLGHEAISGNFSRIPGSIMVLMERMGSLHTVVAGLAGPFGAALADLGRLGQVAQAK
jgi:hypothetical protein